MRSLLGGAVLESEVLRGGLRDTNCKLRLAGEDQPVVLRLYTAEAATCAREVALMGLVSRCLRDDRHHQLQSPVPPHSVGESQAAPAGPGQAGPLSTGCCRSLGQFVLQRERVAAVGMTLNLASTAQTDQLGRRRIGQH
jgi:hypothetical protein